MPSDYAILGLSDTATLDEAKKAWRELVRKFHPDRAGNDSAASDRMAQINAAWDRIRAGKPRRDDSAGTQSRSRSQSASSAFRSTQVGVWDTTESCMALMKQRAVQVLLNTALKTGLPKPDRLIGVHFTTRFKVVGNEIHIFFETRAQTGKNLIVMPTISFRPGAPETARVKPAQILIKEVDLPAGSMTQRHLYGHLHAEGHPSVPIFLHFDPKGGTYGPNMHRVLSRELARRAPAADQAGGSKKKTSPLRKGGRLFGRVLGKIKDAVA